MRRSADAITNLAHENVSIKSKVRSEDGIPPLVALLEAYDPKVRIQEASSRQCLSTLYPAALCKSADLERKQDAKTEHLAGFEAECKSAQLHF